MSTSERPSFAESVSVLDSADKVADVVTSVKKYARQETIEPLRGAGRWLAYGVIASVSLGLALVFGVLGVLRLAQDLGGTVLDGAWSWVPYVISVVANIGLVFVALSRINDSPLSGGK